MRQIGLAQFLRLGIVFEVVVAVGHSESALIGFRDHLRRIFGVLIRTKAKHSAAPIGQRICPVCNDLAEVGFGSQSVDLGESRL